MEKTRLLTPIILAFFLTGVGSSAVASYPQTMTTPSPFVNLPRPTDDPRWATAFAHWDKRQDTEEVLAALAVFEELAKNKPESFEAHLWVCRVNYLMGMRKRRERDSFCRKSIAAGDAALKIKPGDDLARVWRYSSVVLFRDLTEEEYLEVAALGLKYRPVRPLPVPDDDPLWAEAVKKYDARIDRKKALAAIDDFKKLDAMHPDRIEAKLFLCWSYYWLGMTEPSKEGRAELYGIGGEWGRQAMKLEPRNPAANYAFAATLGSYAENAGMLAMVRHGIELAKAIVVVVEEDPTYMYSGFSRYIAASLSAAGELAFRVCDMLGFPQDLIVRVSMFSTRQEPAYLDNYVNLAKMYLTLGRVDDAREALETVINADPAALKYYEPENRIFQKEAQDLYDEHFR